MVAPPSISFPAQFLVNGRLDGTILPDGRFKIERVTVWRSAEDCKWLSEGDAQEIKGPKTIMPVRSSFDMSEVIESDFKEVDGIQCGVKVRLQCTSTPLSPHSCTYLLTYVP